MFGFKFKTVTSSLTSQNHHRNVRLSPNHRNDVPGVDVPDLNLMDGSDLMVVLNQCHIVDMDDQPPVKPIHIALIAS